jgi:hypothetical protein
MRLLTAQRAVFRPNARGPANQLRGDQKFVIADWSANRNAAAAGF